MISLCVSGIESLLSMGVLPLGKKVVVTRGDGGKHLDLASWPRSCIVFTIPPIEPWSWDHRWQSSVVDVVFHCERYWTNLKAKKQLQTTHAGLRSSPVIVILKNTTRSSSYLWIGATTKGGKTFHKDVYKTEGTFRNLEYFWVSTMKTNSFLKSFPTFPPFLLLSTWIFNYFFVCFRNQDVEVGQ